VRIIGVIDLLARRAVHARAGTRESYEPVRAVAGLPIEPGDALALAGTYVDRLGLRELYVADLDAILAARGEGHGPDHRGGQGLDRRLGDTLVAALAALGAPLWLDAGVSSADRARHALGLGTARVVVGLETLLSYDALAEVCNAVGGDRVAFSLDLRDGDPVVASGGIPASEPAHVVAAHAADAGAGAMIVIDLARVGTLAGLDLGLIGRVREAAPRLTLLAGGGIQGLEELVRLADSGCDGALVATALHNGRLGAAEVAAAERLGR
jgi:phosphoribosylformimino-5-aminoimidazole carboxamide ribotide isomerase